MNLNSGAISCDRSCPNCTAKDAVIAELLKLVKGISGNASPVTREQSFYDRCPCNPANGGSGVCGCVRPSMFR